MAPNPTQSSAELVSLHRVPDRAYRGRMNPIAAARASKTIALIVSAAWVYALYIGLLTLGLRFELLQGDAVLYWRESFQLAAPYSTWWVPGYPFILALIRAATRGTLPPAAVMVIVSGTCYLIGVAAVRALAEQSGLKQPEKVALLFAVFPFTGLAYSVWPIADSTAVACCLLSQLSFERRRWRSFALCAACALMVHKAMWFFIPGLILIAAIKHKESRRFLPWAVVPLATWIVAGAIHYRDALWFIRWGIEHLVVSRSVLPVFDGLIGPFLTGELTKILKGLLILGIAGAAAVTLVQSYRRGNWVGISTAATLIFLALIMNQYEVWVVVRFGKLLIIPLVFAASQFTMWHRVLENRVAFGALVTASVATNVAFSYYMVQFFS